MKNGNIVPCGKCPACLANLRQEWVFRLKQEYLDSAFAIFVTLTYDEDHVPENMSVNKKDVQDFHKRLRKHFPSRDLRFYVVSEYGDHTFRPHYHGLYFFKSTYEKSFIYDVFERSWHNGFCSFGDVEEGSIVYCTKYCLKSKVFPEGRTKPFRLVSKMNGGLGSYYLDKMKNFHNDQQQFSFVSYGGKTCRMPAYYKRKLSDRRDRWQMFDEYYSRCIHDQQKRFAEYLQSHVGLSPDEAESRFTAFSKSIADRRDELILKHTKKQKF